MTLCCLGTYQSRRVRAAACLQVFQVQKKDTGQVYAMKVMRKERIIAKDHGEYVRAERNVLTAVFHPYIVTLRCSFQVCNLFLVTTALEGFLPVHCYHIMFAMLYGLWYLQTSSKLYLVLDFINGGHLFFQLYRQVCSRHVHHLIILCMSSCAMNGCCCGVPIIAAIVIARTAKNLGCWLSLMWLAGYL